MVCHSVHQLLDHMMVPDLSYVSTCYSSQEQGTISSPFPNYPRPPLRLLCDTARPDCSVTLPSGPEWVFPGPSAGLPSCLQCQHFLLVPPLSGLVPPDTCLTASAGCTAHLPPRLPSSPTATCRLAELLQVHPCTASCWPGQCPVSLSVPLPVWSLQPGMVGNSFRVLRLNDL